MNMDELLARIDEFKVELRALAEEVVTECNRNPVEYKQMLEAKSVIAAFDALYVEVQKTRKELQRRIKL